MMPKQNIQINLFSATVPSKISTGHEISQFGGKTLVQAADMSLVSHMKLTENKAGMEGLDREKINNIILEASKGR
jgi:hypothetical protein